jgi:hypothetical protein
MTPFTQTTLKTLLRLALYVIAWEPAPDTDPTLVSLKEKLNDAGNTLASDVEANQPS